MERALDAIAEANGAELDEIIQAMIRRYGQVHPGSEMLWMSIPKEPSEDRRRSVQDILAFLEKNYMQ